MFPFSYYIIYINIYLNKSKKIENILLYSYSVKEILVPEIYLSEKIEKKSYFFFDGNKYENIYCLY